MRLISIHALLAESDPPRHWSYMCKADFYPRSPCGERRDKDQVIKCLAHISIHALLAESDAPRRGTGACRRDFYPRSPCGERPSMVALRYDKGIEHFYPRSPCGERQCCAVGPVTKGDISIHALLAESDSKNAAMGNPTLISIHALLAESDR